MTNKTDAIMHRLITIAFILYVFNIDGQLGGIPEIKYFAVYYICNSKWSSYHHFVLPHNQINIEIKS